MSSILTYEVECQLDPDVVADYDAWLPGHIRDVLACAGFLSATIEAPPVSKLDGLQKGRQDIRRCDGASGWRQPVASD